ncbi:MAG: hypothetical protein CVT49_05115 [candidate division Zixibacteria bacterium HGW-Zixibacteria-1]|nr:MAG: hypothetical protein CVT49_05115 [candidate division Zixibacteria bacterium HGW-Zixibacteria-1]
MDGRQLTSLSGNQFYIFTILTGTFNCILLSFFSILTLFVRKCRINQNHNRRNPTCYRLSAGRMGHLGRENGARMAVDVFSALLLRIRLLSYMSLLFNLLTSGCTDMVILSDAVYAI